MEPEWRTGRGNRGEVTSEGKEGSYWMELQG